MGGEERNITLSSSNISSVRGETGSYPPRIKCIKSSVSTVKIVCPLSVYKVYKCIVYTLHSKYDDQ